MAVTCAPYTQDCESRWDAFIEQADNGTIFHLRKFLGYHPPDRFGDASVQFLRDKKLCAVMPAAVREIRGERVLFSHPGASYGGFVLSDTGNLQETTELVRLLIEHAEERQPAQGRHAQETGEDGPR